ncbi:MAG: hypothetical protein P8Z00_06845 [Anaerolineales bacterium]
MHRENAIVLFNNPQSSKLGTLDFILAIQAEQSTIKSVLKHRYLPDPERLSTLAAMILLAYALARFINLPLGNFSVQLPGMYLALQINLRTFLTFLVASLTAAGADWLLRDHPALKEKNTLEHWLLPALTAWVIGLPLFQIPLGPIWWAGFALGGVLLMLVLVAEYIVVDPDDARLGPAAAGLTALSFALFLTLAISLRYSGLRLYLILPALTLAAWLVCLRSLHLRLHGIWAFVPAGVVTLLVGQIAAGLHYWPLSPIAFGLALLGPAYSLTSLIGSLIEGDALRQAIIEPGIVMFVIWGAAFWLR